MLPNINACKIVVGDRIPEGIFRVHSQFNSVTNFVNSKNEIIYLTNTKQKLSANSIFINSVNLPIISSIETSPHIIQLNRQVIGRIEVSEFDSKFSYEYVDLEKFENSIIEIPYKHPSLFPLESMLFILIPERREFFTKSYDVAFCDNALNAARNLRLGKVEEGVKMLKGTGIGLTPAGDDFIAGLIYGLHFNQYRHKRDLLQLIDNTYQIAVGNNLLTNSFLLNAKNESYFLLLKNFISLPVNNKARIESLSELLKMGATSGADLLSGYMFCITHKIGL